MSKKITTTSNFDFIQRNFIEAKKAINEEKRTGIINDERIKGVGLEGASRTGKSWDICVFICHYVTTYQNKQVNICRDHLTTLKKTFYPTLRKVWNLYRLDGRHFNKTASDIYYNNNVIRFVGVNDDIMTAHGLESDLLIGNEWMGVAKDTSDQLEQRCNEFYIFDYNPSATESFLFDMELRPDYRCHHTTIFDNPYAPINPKQKILSYAHPDVNNDYEIAVKAGYTVEQWDRLKQKNVELKTADRFKWEVYGLGRRAKSEDTIFEYQLYVDDPKEYDWKNYGGDFGFKTDPTAMIQVIRNGRNLYLKECIYETGLLNDEIAQKVLSNEWNDVISIWDKAEEKSVNELRGFNIPADWVDKPPNSVSYGIQKMQQFNIFIHAESVNLQEEFKKYRWLKDRNGDYKRNTYGKRVPIDKFNHGIDGVRYVILYHYDILEVENENT